MIALVCPSNRPDRLAAWLEAWRPAVESSRIDARFFVVRDEPETWAQIDADLGDRAWIIPRRSAAIRSYGVLQAAREGAEVIIILDDDCLPELDAWGRGGYEIVAEHVTILGRSGREPGYTSTVRGIPIRGLPPGSTWPFRPVRLNHGLWTGTPDVEGAVQLAQGSRPWRHELPTQIIPPGTLFPMSGMNVAFHRDLLPAMYFGLQGTKQDGSRWGYDRFDDIWCGLVAKKVCDAMGWAVRSGTPWVHHSRASDPVKNAELERAGLAVNAKVWKAMYEARASFRMKAEDYTRFYASVFTDVLGEYGCTLSRAWGLWTDLVAEA